MKVSDSQYAISLFEATVGKSKKDLNKVVDNFFNILATDNVLNHWPKIAAEFRKKYNQANKIIEVEVISAKKMDSETKAAIEDRIKNDYPDATLEWSEKIKKSLIGGAIIRYNGQEINLSIENNLKKMSKHLVS
ncbi:MAG: ATP synthase F1 subunit delta [Patescibacteria group bacterium]|nr:ATP synthase F1 subunit delta [Patescibacteria group bacterium]